MTGRRVGVLVVLCLSMLLMAVDMTVLFTALPTIARELGPSSTQLLWIVDVYALVSAPLLITFGTLGDRFGRRRVLLIGYVVFGAASALAASAGHVVVLILARALLGLGSAMIMPMTLSLTRHTFPDPGERAWAVSAWSAVAGSGMLIGPLLGGVLVEHFGWNSVFLINVPAMALAVVAARWLVPESRNTGGGRWDLPSALLVTAGVLGVAYAIKESGHGALLALPTLGCGVIGAVLLVLFVRRQRRLRHPLLDLGLFADPMLRTAVIAVFVAAASTVGVELLITQYLQLVLGEGPLGAGLRMLPLAGAMVLGSLAAAPLLRRAGSRGAITAGLATVAVSLGILVLLSVQDRPVLLALSLAGQGLGTAAALAAASNAIMSAAPSDQAGQAASIDETAMNLGEGFGVAILGTIAAASYTGLFPALAQVPPDTRHHAAQSLPEAVQVAATLPEALGTTVLDAAEKAFVGGLHTTAVVAAGLLVLTALATLLRRSSRALGWRSVTAEPDNTGRGEP
ncbi:MFS transporter [Saccharopolyspora taberi]|uniref:MFS transporter n=1 Tax=Saccharopolyspora taberi TaxID=60895 RepID=A0ABN3VI63_9PSEU